MAYNSIYRRYRPQTFDDVVGQEHVIRILKNQIKSNSIGHSYLFTGSRGTGKTSIAKIFARAINCLSPIDGSACGQCAACQALRDPSNIDVVELDAASNNGVDEIRTLIDSTGYPPQTVRYKVFIIDEAHMLTKAAGNSLLKTLEEPPEYCVFVLATTEMHSILPTIVSRCLVMDFRLLSFNDIVSRLQYIFEDMGVECSPQAVALMANMGEGCMRDALSIADICMSYSGGKITYDDVIQVLGVSDPRNMLELAEGIIRGDHLRILNKIDELNNMGKAMSVVYSELQSVFSNLLYIKGGFTEGIFNYEQSLLQQYRALAEIAEYDQLGRILDVLTTGEGQLRYANQAKVVVESLCFKAADARVEITPDKLIHRIRELERKVDELMQNGVRVVVSDRQPEAGSIGSSTAKSATDEPPKDTSFSDASASQTAKGEQPTQPVVSTPKQDISPRTAFGRLIDYLKTEIKKSMLAEVLSNATSAEKQDCRFTIYVVTQGVKELIESPANKEIIVDFLSRLYGERIELIVVSREVREKAFVDEVIELFGENIVNIK